MTDEAQKDAELVIELLSVNDDWAELWVNGREVENGHYNLSFWHIQEALKPWPEARVSQIVMRSITRCDGYDTPRHEVPETERLYDGFCRDCRRRADNDE